MSDSLPAATTLAPARPGPPGHPSLLPWEDPAAFAHLHEELVAEHRPAGPTQRHLVEQLGILLWRKRRVLAAERALHLAVLHQRLDADADSDDSTVADRALVCDAETSRHLSASRAVGSTVQADSRELQEISRDEAMTRQAWNALGQGTKSAYQAALNALDPSTRQWWTDSVAAGSDGWQPTAVSLRHFLETEVTQWYRQARAQLAHNPAIRQQAYGESFDPDRATKLQAYDLRLDRQIERTLAVLLKLQDVQPSLAAARATA